MLPKTGPVETYAQMRAALDKPAFLEALPGAAVFIRLDERGGSDEPAPWAFHGSGLPLPVDIPSSDEDVFLDRAGQDTGGVTTSVGPAVDADESTITGPTFQLSIPAARGRATLLVIPRGTTVTIGRDARCGVVVNERSVSREHARIVVDEPTVRGSVGLRAGAAGGVLQAQARARAKAGAALGAAAAAAAAGAATATTGRTFSITDAGGNNGIAVNGKKLARGSAHRLTSGDVVDLGDVALLFLDASELYDGLPRLTSG